MSGQFVSFIKDLAPKAYENATIMERLIFEDPGSAMVKSRNFLEEIIGGLLVTENVTQTYEIKTLFDKISYLSSKGYLDKNIQTVIHDLRKIGNTGAHQSTSDLEQAIKAHKLVYQVACWLYESYSPMHDKVPEYSYPKPVNPVDELKEYINTVLSAVINKPAVVEGASPQDPSRDSSQSPLPFELDLPTGQSYLIRELKRLGESSKEAIESANSFSRFKDYLHIDRKVQRDLVEILENRFNKNKTNLILICGSVGDGKSHLLAFLKSRYPNLVDQYQFINDATESYSPSMNALETLRESLKAYKDENIETSGQKTILAINMGVLHNFLEMEGHDEFSKLKRFIDECGLFAASKIQSVSDDYFDLISIGDYYSYELTVNGAQSEFFSGLMQKVFNKDRSNPFYAAYEYDLKNNCYTMTHFNYEFLLETQVQQVILHIVIESVIKYKLVISARAFLNFLSDIMIVNELTPVALMNDFEKLNFSVPQLLFGRKERSNILKHTHLLNPLNLGRSRDIDQLTIELNTLKDVENVVVKYIRSEKGLELLRPLTIDSELDHSPFMIFSEAVIMVAYLTNEEFFHKVSDPTYQTYLRRLYGMNTCNMDVVRETYNDVKNAIFKWKGSPRRDYLYITSEQNSQTTSYRLAQKLTLRPANVNKANASVNGNRLDRFVDRLSVCYYLGDSKDKSITLEVDYFLYKLIHIVNEGYVPNKQDYDDAIKFVEYMETLMKYGSKQNDLLLNVTSENKLFSFRMDDFNGFTFESEETQ